MLPKTAISTTKIKVSGTAENRVREDYIEIFGAREHNLKNIDVSIPRNKFIVITGISGSGKSSLAFDTLHAEGQRRYMESLSAYARAFIGNMERPDVDKIDGLSPVISIEQKTVSRNPRSTVGTVTEIYDLMRLLFARTGIAYSYNTGKKMLRQSEDKIINRITKDFADQKISLEAPVVKGRKGHYRELFERIAKSGYSKVRTDGELNEIKRGMQLDRYKTHDIDIVVDRILVKKSDRQRIAQSVSTALKEGKGHLKVVDANNKTYWFSRFLMCPDTGLSYDDPAPNTFSFNSPYGACPVCKGLGVTEEITEASIIPDKKISISGGAIAPLGQYRDIWIFKKIQAVLKKKGYDISVPVKNLPQEVLNTILFGDDISVAVPSVKYPGTNWQTTFEGIINFLKKQNESGSDKITEWIKEYTVSETCPECNGARLNKEALHFRIDKRNISELAAKDIQHLADWFEGLEERLEERQRVVAAEILKEIRKRIGFLTDIGLTYLTLDRSLKTLSGGEAQRIRLASQIGTGLVGVLYILDEPSIGLHQRDNMRLINALKKLCEPGNTVIVVEHDKDMMLHSDYILDIGPGAGRHGGHIVAAGTPDEFQKMKGLTADYLNGNVQIEIPKERRKGSGKFITLTGASGNNLKNIDIKLPLGTMICVTGVSGSGKSTLIHETLFPALTAHLRRVPRKGLPYQSVSGEKHIDKIIEIDQSPIGRTPRSNPATYTGVFGDIRNLFCALPEAKIRGYKPGRFSFNVKGGRCETCGGGGKRIIEMDFLPDVLIPCETCRGKRYNRETLEVRFKGKSISDVLDMTVDTTAEFFKNQPKIIRKIKTLKDVGLGYITLGQHATTVSGGEAQRVKLATELSKRDTGKTLYILDEPTTGLHFKDIQHLLDVLNRLADKGNTVLIIEHNTDVIKTADYIIDLGPEGGEKGGEVVCSGTPEEIAQNQESRTAPFLKEELKLK